MSEIRKFIEFDRENTETGIRFANRVDRSSMDVAEAIGATLDELATTFSNNTRIRERCRAFEEWCTSKGMSAPDAIRFSEQATIIGAVNGPDPAASAKALSEEIETFIARAYLFLRLRRDYFFGLTDLLKNRIVAAVGYFRIQCETGSLIVLFQSNSQAGALWRRAAAGPTSKEFYNQHHRTVRRLIDELGLGFYYEQASAMSQHCRVGGVGFGILSGAKEPPESDERLRVARLTYTDTDDLKVFYLFFAHYLRFHGLLIRVLLDKVSELKSEGSLMRRAETLRCSIDRLFQSMKPMVLGSDWSSFLRQ